MGSCASSPHNEHHTVHRNSGGGRTTEEPSDDHDCKGTLSDYILSLRRSEYHRLDKTNNVYFDFTGAALYPESLVRGHTQYLVNNVYGNPHSSNPTSLLATEAVEAARADVLKFFQADPEEYACIFTLNASNALRLVGESYPFRPGGAYLLFLDNHNSVNGIAEFARQKGAAVNCVDTTATLRVDEDALEQLLEECASKASAKSAGGDCGRLFAFPAQSNFSGVKHSLAWVQTAQALGWDVLLDAAAFVPTSPLNLSVVKPEFVSMSFYKIFGYPTGVGALIAKKSALQRLERPWFAGGTVSFVGVKNGVHKKAGTLHEAFEDGTLNFLSIPALSLGFQFINKIPGGMEAVSRHVKALTWRLMEGLRCIEHTRTDTPHQQQLQAQGQPRPVVIFIGPRTSIHRGGTIAMVLHDCNGELVCSAMVEALANSEHISVRSGCFCNPGASSAVFANQWKTIDSQIANKSNKTIDMNDVNQARQYLLNYASAVRISVGMPTSLEDIDKLCKFVQTSFQNRTYAEISARVAALSEHTCGKGHKLCRAATTGAAAPSANPLLAKATSGTFQSTTTTISVGPAAAAQGNSHAGQQRRSVVEDDATVVETF